MKLQRVITAVGVSAASLLGAGCQKKLDTDAKKASYAIGQQIGSNLKKQDIEFDSSNVLAMSISEAAQGKESKLEPEELTGFDEIARKHDEETTRAR